MASISHESLTSQETLRLLLSHISTDKEFYNSLNRQDEGEKENQDGNDDHGGDGDHGKMVCYNEVDSSKTIGEAIADVIGSTPADCLADIYADKWERLSDSDTEDRGVGMNLDMYTGHEFSTCGATGQWMN